MSSKPEMQGFAFPPPVSRKDTVVNLKPNAHPYPIMTTSTALLTRSNSSPQHQAHHAKNKTHYYVPSPSPSPTQPKPKSISTHPNGHGHRYSRSLSSDSPRPLPVPPSPSDQQQHHASRTESPSPIPRRSKRTETLPTPSTPEPQGATEDLPADPKSWTPSQLASYLSTALRVRSGESLNLPARVADDIAAFVRSSRVTGKSFLRFEESDLESYGINKLWRSALLSAAHELRRNVLKGRIWGADTSFENSPHSNDITPNSRQLRRSNSFSYLPSSTFNDDEMVYGSPASAASMEDLSRGGKLNAAHSGYGGRYRNGRVKGMVDSFERSSSFDDGPPSYFRERSGSTSSSGSSGNSSVEDSERRSTFRPARQLPIPPNFSPLDMPPIPAGEEEPTMEELLQSSAHLFPDLPVQKKYTEQVMKQHKIRGVHAWEADDGVGVTVKRVVNANSVSDKATGPPRTAEDIFEFPAEPRVDVGVTVKEETPAKVDIEVGTDGENEDDAKLHADIETTKSLLADFRLRLADVEHKIEEMEQKEREREAAEVAKAAQKERKRVSPYERLLDPKTITALPSYLVLMSIGVCAVVFKVVLRRTIGAAFGRKY